jgi:cation transport regulator ChaB
MVLRSDSYCNGLKSPEELREWLNSELQDLYDAALRHDAPAIKRKLREIVPEYSPQETESVLTK